MFFHIGSTRIVINMWNPVYAIAPVVLLLVSLPLAIFAIITTSIAITLLSLRALVVYFELLSALVSAWLSPPLSKAGENSYQSSLTSSPDRHSPTRSRTRRTSNSSNASHDTVMPVAQGSRLSKSDSLTALIGTSEATRDFEGVGGWRMPGDDDEEALWMGINSRLQLPADEPIRRHKRSLTGGAIPSQRSPVQSRVRTPVRFVLDEHGGYFPPQPVSNMTPMNTTTGSTSNHVRRKSGSASSTTSSTGSGLMMSVKEAGD